MDHIKGPCIKLRVGAASCVKISNVIPQGSLKLQQRIIFGHTGQQCEKAGNHCNQIILLQLLSCFIMISVISS